jgi:signal transduction histidine kinase
VDDFASSARLVALADAERRTIERALHDGIQQDLVALSVRVQLARTLAERDLAAALGLLEEIVADVHEALNGVQALSEQIYPSLLTSQGLVPALRALGVTVHADAAELGRYRAEIEEAVYFACREAIAAGNDKPAAVTLRRDADVLYFELDALAAATAVTHARDRIEALRGRLTVTDDRIAAAIPLYDSVSAR